MAGIVVGTSGHIDHGKTSLIRALTGIDTDRLAEEKRRGISIELGFAHLDLADGQRISFIDVPGHERFIRNMLAGVAGVDAVMLIVAADAGVKPQTREHLDICRLLAIKQGLIVITKRDLANDEQLAETRFGIADAVRSTFLEGSPTIEVSSQTGEGLPELKRELAALAARAEPRDTMGLARLPIDRAFAMKGFGTVVTGTLWSGRIATSNRLVLKPGGREVRVRGVQVHGAPVNEALAGQRTAVNLSGVNHDEVRRGMVLMAVGEIPLARTVDTELELLSGTQTPVRKLAVIFHTGTSEVSAALTILGACASHTYYARLQLAEPIVVLPGDRFVLRRPSPAETIAGGTVIEISPPARMQRTKAVARLEKLRGATLAQRIEIFVAEARDGQAIRELMHRTGCTREQIIAAAKLNGNLLIVDGAQHVLSKQWVEAQRTRIVQWLAGFHARQPSAEGAPIGAARQDVPGELMATVLEGFAPIRVEGDLIALLAHRPHVSNEDARSLSRLESAFRNAGFQPPAPSSVLADAGLDAKKARALLEALIKSQRLVRVSDNLVFHADVIQHIRTSLATHKGRKFLVPEFKEWTNISRKYAIPLLEYLDRQRVTRREGDARVVL